MAQGVLQILGIPLLIIIRAVPWVCYVLPKSSKSMFIATNYHANDLLKVGMSKKGAKKMPTLHGPDTVACEHHTEDQQRLRELHSGDWGC